MLVLELGKQWLHPDITVWESHIITVVFSGVAVALAGYVILRRRDVLHDRIVVEAVERRHAQQHIHMLAHTVRSVGECVSVTDMNDRVIFVNKAFLDTYGFEESDLLGRPIAVVRSDKNREEVALEVFPATLRGGWRGELWNRKKDGTDFQIFLSTSIVRDDAGAPVALVGVARDITEEKRTEEALKRGRESDRIVTLAAGIAHEFNNLLQIVLTSTALALEDVPADGPARGCLQSVVHASERASNLTAQLLVYAGRGTLVRFTVFDLNDEIRERAAFIRALMPPAAIFDLDLASGSALIRADRQQIQQVLTSLVTNAAEAMADRPGRASVRTRIEDVAASDPRPWVAGERIAPGRYVCLSVEDQGVGMEAETISRIFDPFFSTKFLGRGMGLPAVLGVAHATGGAIAVDSTPGRGTRVTVAFPCPPADS
ncbi:MAG: PAS domain S-box protein [Acidobacteria bacterium]|nr:PAS domain S-box protein [Acidobacteriota bacterium]